MNIAELFVRIRGDTTDLHRKLTDAERALIRMDGASRKLNGTMNSAQLQTGRLGSQFANLTTHIAGVHPVVGNLAQVMGNFAIGGALTAGVLIGVGAIAVAWDRLTKAVREATKAQNDAIASIEKAAALKILGPGGQTVADVDLARKKADALKGQITMMEALIVKDALDADVVASNLIIQGKINKLIVERQHALDRVAEGESIVKERVNATLDTAIPKALKLKDTFNAVRGDAAEEYQLQQQIAALKLGMVLEELQKIADLHAEIAGQAGFTGMPNISMPFEGLDKNDKKQLQELGIIADTTEESGNKIRDAIWGSATQMANQIVSALNVGGGGKGSNLGGALGGTAGFAAGFMLGGPIGGAIGSTIGNIAGSLFGGLFDSNTKATNANTAATLANTAAMLLFAPAGFKSEPYRYNASDPRPIDALGRTVRWNASRGGANPLLGT